MQALALNCKHWTRLERLARNKHSSLLQKFVNYGQRSFITLGPEMHFCVVQSDATTFGTTTLRIMAFGITTLSKMVVIVRVSLLDIQKIVIPSVTFLFVNLSVIMLSVFMACVMMLCDTEHHDTRHRVCVVMLSVILLCVIMLSRYAECHYQ